MRKVRIGSQYFELGSRLGKGGEGEVFALAGRSSDAVKIYKAALRSSREDKIRAMVAGALAKSTDLVAFPKDVVLHQSGQFVGFVMKLVSGYRPIHELYSPKSRRINFPDVDYRFLIRAAGNTARAVAKVHQSGCVIGDLNHSGVLVSKDATVALIDADSFQVSANGKLFRCVVGVPDFTPPELHGKSLSNVTRTKEHDYFGLAVVIFHFLFMGRHPYAGVYSRSELSLSEAIEQHRFAFSKIRQAQTQTTPPPGSLILDDLYRPVEMAFEAAFGLDPMKRPDSGMWVALLDKFEKSLSRCSNVKAHFYASAAGRCVWCKLSAESGIDMFPDILAPNIGRSPHPNIHVGKILSAIDSIKLPTIEYLIPIVSTGSNGPSSAAAAAKRELFHSRMIGAVCCAGAAIGFINFPDVFILWMILGVFGLFRVFSSEIDASPFRREFDTADQQAHQAVSKFLNRSGAAELYILKRELEIWATEYKGLNGALQRELTQLTSTREARQKYAFLDRFLIRNASISGIGPAKKATLASFGIETAADVNSSAVRRVPGFGKVMTSKLLHWRRKYERRFRYNPTPDASDKQAENAVRAKYAAKQSDLEAKIKKGYANLTTGMNRLSSVASSAKVDRSLVEALQYRERAAADMKSVGITVPAFTPTPPKSQIPNKPSYTPSGAPPSPRRRATRRGAQTSTTPDCPKCGSRMVRRTARKGRNPGSQFWGCSRYPRCKGTRS